MRILLTNDDGYRAEGINILFEQLLKNGHDVILVAPEQNSSGAGQSIAVYTPISITQISERIYFVSSTPADSVRLGLQVVYENPKNYPELIISGINLGENIGEDVLYSGTVGAAREGAIHRISSLAISTPGPEFKNLDAASTIVLDLVDRLEKHKDLLKDPFIWNVNIPNKPFAEIKGYEASSIGLRPLHQPLVKQVTSRGHVIYWQGESSAPKDTAIGTDINVYLKGEKVSITPIEIVPTDFSQMPLVAAVTA